MEVITVAAHKGGVGKTTTALALSAAFARSGLRTLLIDLDPQGCATRGLGLHIEEEDDVPSRTTLGLLLDTAARLTTVMHDTRVPNLWIAPATLNLADVLPLLHSRARREKRLKLALECEARLFERVVIDCRPDVDPLVELGLYAADRVIVPCQMEARGTDGIAKLVHLAMTVQDGDVPWRVLRTRVDPRKTKTNAAVEAQLEAYAGRVLETVIPVCEALNQAQMVGQDIYEYARDSSGALAYAGLVREVIEPWAQAASRT